LPEAAAKAFRNEADLAHRGFPSDYQVTASQSGAATSLFKMCFVGVALGTEVEATVSDVLAAQDKRTTICPERC